MESESFPVNNLLATAKSREVQRALQAEMRGAHQEAVLHFLAAAHMELVLANDYDHAGESALAFRSRVSAASSLWRAGHPDQGRAIFNDLLKAHPAQVTELQRIQAELAHDYPAVAS